MQYLGMVLGVFVSRSLFDCRFCELVRVGLRDALFACWVAFLDFFSCFCVVVYFLYT